jgi:hypothetical protein
MASDIGFGRAVISAGLLYQRKQEMITARIKAHLPK